MPAQSYKLDPQYNPQYISDPHKLDLSLPFSGTSLRLHMTAFTPEDRSAWAITRHSNADYEVHILLSGSTDLEVGTQTVCMAAGSAVLLAPGCFHCPHGPSEDLERFTFSFLPEADSPLEQQLARLQAFAAFSCTSRTLSLCRDILDEYCREDPFRDDAVSGMLTQLLVQIFRSIALEPFSREAEPPQEQNQQRVIMDRFFFPWPYSYGTEKDLAELLHVSTRQLQRILLRNYGMSFRQKLVQSRMEYAGGLLLTTDDRVCDIGTQVGYREESSFFKAFQAYYGMTPLQYRAKMKK